MIKYLKSKLRFFCKETMELEKTHLLLIERIEGFRSTSYLDTSRNKTVGYGFNMDSVGAIPAWEYCRIEKDFDEVYEGYAELTREEAYALFMYFWKISEALAKDRTEKLGLLWGVFSDMKKFVLTDIAYNTGNISSWTDVFNAFEDKDVLYHGRRRQKIIDSRLAKIGYYFKVIGSLSEAKDIGLTQALYLK